MKKDVFESMDMGAKGRRRICAVKCMYFCQVMLTFVAASSHYQEAFLRKNKLVSIERT